MKIKASLFVLLVISGISYSQIDSSLILGLSQKNNGAAMFDLSDPTGVNIEVNLWGYVRYPGRYRVPINTTFMDLMSFSGGPTDESNLKEIRIIRNANDPSLKPQIIKMDYDDLLWGENVSSKPKINPVLIPGDVVVVLKERRYTFRDDMTLIIPIITTLVSVATLIITISNN